MQKENKALARGYISLKSLLKSAIGEKLNKTMEKYIYSVISASSGPKHINTNIHLLNMSLFTSAMNNISKLNAKELGLNYILVIRIVNDP